MPNFLFLKSSIKLIPSIIYLQTHNSLHFLLENWHELTKIKIHKNIGYHIILNIPNWCTSVNNCYLAWKLLIFYLRKMVVQHFVPKKKAIMVNKTFCKIWQVKHGKVNKTKADSRVRQLKFNKNPLTTKHYLTI